MFTFDEFHAVACFWFLRQNASNRQNMIYLSILNSLCCFLTSVSVDKTAHKLITEISDGREVTKMTELLDKLFNWSISMGGRILAALIIFIIGRLIIKILNKLFDHLLTRRSVDVGVKTFFKSLINALLIILLIIAVINKLGIETTSFAALLASFGVAIGMAMSGNLSNLVGGILILLFRPYKVGDWIEVNGIVGQVQSIEIFHTVLRTYDATNVYFANGNMSTSVIKNFSKTNDRRIEFKVSLEYGQDLAKVEKVLLNLASENSKIQRTPEPTVNLNEFADSSVDVVFRVWVKNEDYWSVRYEMNRKIYDSFNAEGISFPFPQITVHQEKC